MTMVKRKSIMEKFGIDNLKTVLGTVIGFSNEIAVDLEDGKITWGESADLLDNLLQVPGVVTAAPHIKDELEDLSDEERTEVHTYIAEKFDIPNDDAEVKVEAAADALIVIGKLITLFSKKAV